MGNRTYTIPGTLAAIGAGSDGDFPIPVATRGTKLYILGVVLIANGAVAEDACDYAVMSVKKGGTTIASWSTQTVAGGGQGSLADATSAEMVFATGADRTLEHLDELTIDKTEAGCGVAWPGGSVAILVEERPL